MRKALVTGGAGFIGSHVADHLLAQGMGVVVLDDLSGGFQANVPSGARFVEGSITDSTLVGTLFEENDFDYVFHLAAYAAEGLSHFIRRFNYNNNLIGSVNLINEAVKHNVKCFVFTSSIAVYGANQLPMTEDLVPAPEDPYGIAKYAVELDLGAAREMFGLNYVVFRPHNVYGERQNIADKYRNVLGIFMNQIMSGQAVTIFGDGAQSRAFTHIDDVAPVIANVIGHPDCFNDVFNIGSDQPFSVNELASMVANAFGAEPKLLHLPARNEVKDAYCSHEKIAREMGFRSGVSLEEGVARMAEWVKSVGSRASPEFAEIEILKGLPPSWSRPSQP